MELREATKQYYEVAKDHRRALHRIPEQGDEEWKTHAYIKAALEACSPDEIRAFAKTGLRAVFRRHAGEDAARCVALRADMDALPMQEKSKCAFESEHPGMMHACGHDGHMAALLTMAQYIADHRAQLDCDVVLLFQPAEETTGGAERMVKEGALKNPDVTEIYGMHMMPDIPLGKIGTCAGPLMAATSEINIDILGKSSHGAMPHLGVDAVAAMAHLYTLLQTNVARTIDPTKPALITIGRVEAGTQRNILAGSARMEGIIRTLSNDVYKELYTHILGSVHALETAFGVTCEITQHVHYPCVENDPALTAKVMDIVGSDLVVQKPRMIAEDFSYYQLTTPGVFVFCGCMDEKHKAPLHADTFDFDEQALLYGLELFIRLICRTENA